MSKAKLSFLNFQLLLSRVVTKSTRKKNRESQEKKRMPRSFPRILKMFNKNILKRTG